MYQYSIIQWLFFFYFYSFFGWCFESAYVSISKKRFVNRGFMRGPFLPLYGTGGIMMLLVSMPFQDNIYMVYVAGCLGATALEYVTGVVMEALFKVRYWDYSDRKFNFQGHICLSSSLAWGFLTIFMTEFLHKQVEKIVLLIPNGVLTVVTLFLTAFIFSDFSLSFKAAMDLRDVLIQMEKAKAELMRLQKRLDVVIAVTEEELLQRKEDMSDNLEMKVEDIRASIETKLENLRDRVLERPSDYSDRVKAEMKELFTRYRRYDDERRNLTSMKDFFRRNLIRSNPDMRSVKFEEALEELKKKAIKYRSQKESEKEV
ncbi:MAG: hypothetical protein IJZ34_08755 [Lachnospiraceae bacterium]|nr:hypothetical protein [Lachnospiraceae bacterium]